MPARNSFSTEMSATAAYKTMITEGGMMGPMTDAATTTAAENDLL